MDIYFLYTVCNKHHIMNQFLQFYNKCSPNTIKFASAKDKNKFLAVVSAKC